MKSILQSSNPEGVQCGSAGLFHRMKCRTHSLRCRRPQSLPFRTAFLCVLAALHNAAKHVSSNIRFLQTSFLQTWTKVLHGTPNDSNILMRSAFKAAQNRTSSSQSENRPAGSAIPAASAFLNFSEDFIRLHNDSSAVKTPRIPRCCKISVIVSNGAAVFKKQHYVSARGREISRTDIRRQKRGKPPLLHIVQIRFEQLRTVTVFNVQIGNGIEADA